jgi:hypothetical protein
MLLLQAGVGMAVLANCGCGEADAPATASPAAPAAVDSSSGIDAAIEPQPVAAQVEQTDADDEAHVAFQSAVENAEVERIYRPDDTRPRHDDARAGELGIARYESRRLLLYSDIAPEIARELPPLMDEAYEALESYFGPMPPARDGSEYQMTGYIMGEKDRFLAAGMLPERALESLVHGIHRGAEFWMYEQEYDYYRRHLMIHEGTHCFMMVLPGKRPPVWYLEGMAEYFGTHRLNDDGTAEFGVMPDDPAEFVGFGRVEMIRTAIDEGRVLTVAGVTELSDNEFVVSRTEPYAWSWAFCKFLDAHPRYQDRFRALGAHLVGEEFYRLQQNSFAPDLPVLAVEWELFARNLGYGYDIPRSAIEFRRGEPLPPGASVTAQVRADQGWQSSGVWLEAGRRYAVSAEGEVVLAAEPKPWLSEPQGISIRYSQGKPIGRLVAAIQSEQPPEPDGTGALWHVLDIGPGAELMPEVTGTLYLRVNDLWGEVADNTGEYRATIGAAE